MSSWGSDTYKDGYSFTYTTRYAQDDIKIGDKTSSTHIRYFERPDKKWAWGAETTFSKKRRRKYDYYVKLYCQIDEQYMLGLTASEIHYMAYHLAEREAQSELEFYNHLATYEGVISVVLVIVSVAITIITWGGTTIFANAAVGNAVAVFSSVAAAAKAAADFYFYDAANSAMKLQLEAGMQEAKASGLKNIQAAQEQSNTLTALMVYQGYKIYANGEIYNQQNAGSETFNCNIAFDTTKGLRGDLQKSELGDKIAGRYGQDLAGGTNFAQNAIQTPFPLAKSGLSRDEQLDTLGDKLKFRTILFAKGFQKLLDNKFAQGGAEDGSITAQTIYERAYKARTDAIKRVMKSVDFADKLKNYNRGLRFGYGDWLCDEDFKEKKDPYQYAIEAFSIDNFKRYMQSEDISLDDKATYLINSIYYSFFGALGDLADRESSDFSCSKSHANMGAFSIDSEQRAFYHSVVSTDKVAYVSILSNESSKFENGAEKYTFGYTGTSRIYKDSGLNECFTLGDFGILNNRFKDFGEELSGDASEYETKELIITGDTIKEAYENEFLLNFCRVKGAKDTFIEDGDNAGAYKDTENFTQYLYAFSESKTGYYKIKTWQGQEKITQTTLNFWSIDLVKDDIFTKLSTPLSSYLSDEMKEALKDYDFSSVEIKEVYFVKKEAEKI